MNPSENATPIKPLRPILGRGRRFSRLVLPALLLVVWGGWTGCSTTGTARMYAGPAKPANEVADLFRIANYVTILSVDGQKVPYSKRATILELLPGQHTVECSFRSEYMDTGYTSDPSAKGAIRLTFDAQAGYSYWINPNVNPFTEVWQPQVMSGIGNASVAK